MSVEKPMLEELIGLCESEAEKRKWFAGAASVLNGLKGIKREQEQAERARDKAFADRDAALKEIATKRAKYEADMKASLADLERVTQERAELVKKEKAAAGEELAALFASIARAREAKALAEGQLAAYLEESDRETVAVATGLKALREEERAVKERLGSFAATLKS